MLMIAKDFLKEMKEKNLGIQELADYLVKNNTVYDLAMQLAEYMMKDKERLSSKIVVSEEEYRTIMSMFRVRGLNEDGTANKRGRPRKED